MTPSRFLRLCGRLSVLLAVPSSSLADALGTHGTHAYAISSADGGYGQAIISRWPLVYSSVHDLSYPEPEPRRAISADFATPAGKLRVIATHLGLSFRERNQQAHILLKLVGCLEVPTVLIGDLNDWLWACSVRHVLGRVLTKYTNLRTFPAHFPLLKPDRIWSPTWLVLSVATQMVTQLPCRIICRLLQRSTSRARRTADSLLRVCLKLKLGPPSVGGRFLLRLHWRCQLEATVGRAPTAGVFLVPRSPVRGHRSHPSRMPEHQRA
jgi:hypothetical protein